MPSKYYPRCMKATVKIQYGIFAGERTGTRLRKALRRAGYEVVRDVNKADIVIAHSAGCFWLPEAPSKHKLVLIDPPYWPGRSIKARARSRSYNNWHFRQFGYPFRPWLVRNVWGVYYAGRDLRRTLRILRYAPGYHLEEIIHNRNALLVRNEHDDWLTPDLGGLKRSYPHLKVVTVPGDHDDFNYHPEHYVDLLQSLL